MNEAKRNSPGRAPEGRTADLISRLAADPTPPRTRARALTLPGYAFHWLAGGAVILALSIWLLPIREDLAERFGSLDYYLLFSLWFLATFLSALKVYGMAFPDSRGSRTAKDWSRFAPAPLLLLAAWSVWNLNLADFGYQLYRESRPLNGGCGLVILTAGLLHAGFLFSWLRKGAPTETVTAGAWVAISTGAYASFLVQFACPNEHAMHVILWHFVPMTLLTAAAGFSARRLLRW